MKKLFLFCIVVMLSTNAIAQKITGADVNISPNGTADLELSIESEELAAIAQVTLQFPDNLSIKKNSRGRYLYTKGELCTDDHAVTVQDKTDGILVLVKNEYGDAFEAASGVLITIPLTAGEIATGEYEITMTGIVLGTNDNPSRRLNTVTEGTVKVIVKNEAVIEVGGQTSIQSVFGEQLTAPSVTVSQGYDGTLSYQSSNEQVVKVAADGKLTVVGVGSAVITISGTETTNWKAPAVVTYNVQIDKGTITPIVTLEGWIYGQTANVPTVTGNTGNGIVSYLYKVKEAADDTYSASVPVNVGDYTVKAVVEATANYNGSEATADFTITPKSVAASMIQSIADLVYTGSALTPQITVKDGNTLLALTKDYTVAYTNNTNAGMATAIITGHGNYKDTASKTFAIQKASITPVVTLTGWTYGQPSNVPIVSGNSGNGTLNYLYKVRDAIDNTYSAEVPINAGFYTVKVVVEATANYNGGEATADFTIAAKALTEKMVGDIEDIVYTGSAIEPKPEIMDGKNTLVEGTDYTISYSDNTAPGNATITITGKGNYQGTVTIQFVIKKKGDANDDNVVDAIDIQDVINAIVAGNYSGNLDVNGDGVVDALDIQDIISEIVSQ